MRDPFGRDIRYLRLSITEACNLRCTYCISEDGSRHGDELSVQEIEAIARAAVSLGLTKIRITGGEPLVRRDVLDICTRIGKIPGLDELCMTTNGILLADFAEALHGAGVNRVNVSLDSLDPVRFATLTRGGDLSQVRSGIEAAREAGLQVKLNVVLMKDVNDTEIADFAALTKEPGIQVRFIELMPIGMGAALSERQYLSADAVLEACPELIPDPAYENQVAAVYRLPGAKVPVGLIRPMSQNFCARCNRVRVTADGKLKPCLHTEEEILLRGLSGEALQTALEGGITGKPSRHHMDASTGSESQRGMHRIGG